MKILAYVVAATIFEAVGDAVMRVALRSPYALPGRIALFALASILLTMYGLFLNLAPVEFATVTGIYLASLFVAFQIVNYLFFRHTPSAGVLLGGSFIVAGAAIIYFWK
jgi:drug/metabolite transporter (DMT)-like permease